MRRAFVGGFVWPRRGRKGERRKSYLVSKNENKRFFFLFIPTT